MKVSKILDYFPFFLNGLKEYTAMFFCFILGHGKFFFGQNRGAHARKLDWMVMFFFLVDRLENVRVWLKKGCPKSPMKDPSGRRKHFPKTRGP